MYSGADVRTISYPFEPLLRFPLHPIGHRPDRGNRHLVYFFVLDKRSKPETAPGLLVVNLDFSELHLILADVILQSPEQQFRMLSGHHDSCMHLGFWDTRKNTGEVNNELRR